MTSDTVVPPVTTEFATTPRVFERALDGMVIHSPPVPDSWYSRFKQMQNTRTKHLKSLDSDVISERLKLLHISLFNKGRNETVK